MMKITHKSQMLKLSLIASLLAVAPLLSSSLRGTYLYFIFNLLIIALGIEAGLLSSSSSNNDSCDYAKKTTTTVTVAQVPQQPTEISQGHALLFKTTTADEMTKSNCMDQLMIIPHTKKKVVEKCTSAKIVSSTVVKVHKVKRCPSTPSIFFIGGCETEAEELDLSHHHGDEKEVQELDEVVPSGQELYNKAETFIGNFYKQLKMQREESWKRIHGLYHNAC